MLLIGIRNSYTVLYYCIPLKHVTHFRKRILHIYFTKYFSATYQQQAICLRNSSQFVAVKGRGKSSSNHLKMGCALKKG